MQSQAVVEFIGIIEILSYTVYDQVKKVVLLV
jgi:hypothetical protein